MSLTTKLEHLLQRTYGYPHFRPGQLEIITALLTGRDVLAILPTGGGKSLCFQIPGLYRGGTTLVVSPLISLMQDQVANLTKHGVRATFLNSTLTPEQQRRTQQAMIRGDYQFVYLSPEKLASRHFQAIARQTPLNLVAVDEAHCVSVWGSDFRPEYQQIGRALRAIFPDGSRPPVIALTATANRSAQADIVRYCQLTHPYHAQASFARDNLKIMVTACHNEHDKILKIISILQRHPGETGIIYTLTRSQTVFLAQLLNRLLQPTRPFKIYHGGLDKQERQRLQEEFIAGQTPVIIATNAFGMGVDQPHVRFVIHAQISSNLENYFQEIGRGGRDGQLARAYTFYTPRDLEISLGFITGNPQLSRARQKILLTKLRQIQKFLHLKTCRQKFVLAYFDELRPHWQCQLCDNCTHARFTHLPATRQRFQNWQVWRQELAKKEDLIPSSIITDLSLSYLSLIPWRCLPSLTLVPGIGRGFVDRFQKFLPP